MPEAATEKVAACPDAIVWLAGCVVISGATPAELTVTVVEPLMVPEVALTTELPAATALSIPDVPIVATEEVAEFHVAVALRFCVLLSL